MPAIATHGVRAFMSSGKLPDDCGHIRREVSRLERQLEETVLNLRNVITTYEAALIQTARRCETVYRLLGHWLNHTPDLTLEQKQSVARDQMAANKNRDAAIKELNINVDPRKHAIDALYADVKTE